MTHRAGTAVATPSIGTEKPEKSPFPLLLVVQPTIPNRPLYLPGPITPENTPEDGATKPIARTKPVEKGVGVVARVESPTGLLPPVQARERDLLSGAPWS